MRVRAVIFDMDGVLVDSEPTWVASEIAVFARHGLRLTPEQCAETRGLRVDAVARHWFARHPWTGASPEEVAHEIVDEVVGRVAASPRPLPGAITVPHRVRALGLRCGLASSSSRRLIDAVVHALDLAPAMEVLCSAEDHPRGKPHPAVYLAAAEALGVEPEACVAVEDSIRGLIAARAASMRTVAIPDPDRRHDPRFRIAHHVLDDLEGLITLLTAPGSGSRAAPAG